MTSPPQRVRVTCPECGREYEDWWRPSINLALGEHFDEEYLEAARSATCPGCGHRVYFDQLVVTEDWEFRLTARAPEEEDPTAEGGD